MSKKTSAKKSPKSETAIQREAGERKTPPPAAPRKGATTKAPKPVPAPRERDPRLPPVGTELTKRNRAGEVVATATIVDDGIRYDGQTYKTLSSAAVAAAKALGLGGKTQNGYVFWGLDRAGEGDVIEILERSLGRVRDQAARALRDPEARTKAERLLAAHRESLDELVGTAS